MLKAKFRCINVMDNGNTKTVTFNATPADKSDNFDLSTSQPYGTVSINIETKNQSSKYFQPNTDYVLTLQNQQDWEAHQNQLEEQA